MTFEPMIAQAEVEFGGFSNLLRLFRDTGIMGVMRDTQGSLSFSHSKAMEACYSLANTPEYSDDRSKSSVSNLDRFVDLYEVF